MNFLRKSRFFRSLSFVIALNFILPPGALMQMAWAGPRSAVTQVQVAHIARNELSQALRYEPFVEWLKAQKDLADYRPDFSVKDPLVDRDPYFLRSQSWVAGAGDSDTSLRLPVGDRVLEIRQALRLLYSDSEFVFLAALQGGQIFKNAPVAGEDDGQGIFVLRRSDLTLGARNSSAVPLYFFPLPGNGWAGEVRAFEAPSRDAVFLSDSANEVLPLNLQDVRDVVRVSQLAYMLAVGMALQHGASSSQSAEGMPRLPLPPRGSTASFGLVFTGLDADHPARNVFAQVQQPHTLQALLRYLSAAGISAAHAEEAVEQVKPGVADAPIAQPEASALTDEAAQSDALLVGKLIRVGIIVGGAFAAGVVLKYTVLRKHFKALHEKEKAERGDAAALTVFQRLRRELREWGDVFAYNLNVFSQFAPVWFARSVEFVLDRHLGKAGSAENSRIRRLFNATVGFTGKVSEKVPVNLKTWFYGTVIHGGIDTLFVFVQLFHVVPWMAHGIAAFLPGLKDRVEAAYQVGNPNVDMMNRNEVIRNASSYTTGGAAAFSRDIQDQYMMEIHNEVRNQMRREGKDFNDPQHKSDFDKRVDDLLNLKLKQMGLPGKDEFVYDAATLYDLFKGLGGYTVSHESKDAAKVGDALWGDQRPGLLKPAVAQALKRAKELLRTNPNDAQLKSAVDVLTHANTNFGVAGAFVKAPIKSLMSIGKNGVRHFVGIHRDIRRQLLLLSYEGDVRESLKYLPKEWTEKFGEAGTRLAGQLFRRSLSTLMTGSPEMLQGPSSDNLLRYMTEAEGKAKARLVQDNLTENEQFVAANMAQGMNEVEAAAKSVQQLRQKHLAEYELLLGDAVQELADAAGRDAEVYKAPKLDRVAKGQIARARATALKEMVDKRFSARAGSVPQTEQELRDYEESFAHALVREFGLHMDFTDVPDLEPKVHEEAHKATEKHFVEKATKAELEYMNALPAIERAEMRGMLYAENLIGVYLQKTVQSEDISPLSPTQPGRFQALRQSKAVRASKLLTRLLRAAEAVFPETQYRKGLWSAMQRNLPLLEDAKSAVQRYLLRRFITWFTAIYAFNYLVWGINPTAPQLFTFIMQATFFIVIPMQVLARFFKMQDLKPMGKIPLMMFFAFIYTWCTFLGSVPEQIFIGDVSSWWNTLKESLGSGVAHAAEGVKWVCEKILDGGKK